MALINWYCGIRSIANMCWDSAFTLLPLTTHTRTPDMNTDTETHTAYARARTHTQIRTHMANIAHKTCELVSHRMVCSRAVRCVQHDRNVDIEQSVCVVPYCVQCGVCEVSATYDLSINLSCELYICKYIKCRLRKRTNNVYVKCWLCVPYLELTNVHFCGDGRCCLCRRCCSGSFCVWVRAKFKFIAYEWRAEPTLFSYSDGWGRSTLFYS